MPLPGGEAEETTQASWLLWKVTSSSSPEHCKEKATPKLLQLPQLDREMPGCPGQAGSQADAPLLLRLEDMSSQLKDNSTRQRGCDGQGKSQQEGMTGRMRDERRSQFTLECKYGSGMSLRRGHHPPLGPRTRTRASWASSELVGSMGQQRPRPAWVLCRSEEEGQGLLQKSGFTVAVPALCRLHVPWQGDVVSAPINSKVSTLPACVAHQLGDRGELFGSINSETY